jgi:hypothetical protein
MILTSPWDATASLVLRAGETVFDLYADDQAAERLEELLPLLQQPHHDQRGAGRQRQREVDRFGERETERERAA